LGWVKFAFKPGQREYGSIGGSVQSKRVPRGGASEILRFAQNDPRQKRAGAGGGWIPAFAGMTEGGGMNIESAYGGQAAGKR
jgi:hypothetical protein